MCRGGNLKQPLPQLEGTSAPPRQNSASAQLPFPATGPFSFAGLWGRGHEEGLESTEGQ